MIQERHLLHAFTLARHGHFGRAADALAISQPALSRSIQALETSLGLKLFDRDRRHVRPTAYGDLLLERGSVILRDLEDLDREFQLLRDVQSGSLRVALGPYPAQLYGFLAIGRALAGHPRLRFRVEVRNWRTVMSAVIDRTIDLGLAEISAAAGESRLESTRVGTHRAVFFCRPTHEILTVDSPGLDRLIRYPWVSTPLPRRLAEHLPSEPTPAGQVDSLTGDFLPAVQFDVVSELAQVVEQSDAIGLATLPMLAAELARGSVDIVGFHPAWLQGEFGFIHRRGRSLSPIAHLYMDAVLEIKGELAARQAELESRYLSA